MVCKLISCSPYPGTIPKLHTNPFFFFPQKSFNWIKTNNNKIFENLVLIVLELVAGSREQDMSYMEKV